jgi:hypothetical protein
VEDVDLFICHECGTVFLFSEDLEDHKHQTGHKASLTKKSTLVKVEDRIIAFFDAA